MKNKLTIFLVLFLTLNSCNKEEVKEVNTQQLKTQQSGDSYFCSTVANVIYNDGKSCSGGGGGGDYPSDTPTTHNISNYEPSGCPTSRTGDVIGYVEKINEWDNDGKVTFRFNRATWGSKEVINYRFTVEHVFRYREENFYRFAPVRGCDNNTRLGKITFPANRRTVISRNKINLEYPPQTANVITDTGDRVNATYVGVLVTLLHSEDGSYSPDEDKYSLYSDDTYLGNRQNRRRIAEHNSHIYLRAGSFKKVSNYGINYAITFSKGTVVKKAHVSFDYLYATDDNANHVNVTYIHTININPTSTNKIQYFTFRPKKLPLLYTIKKVAKSSKKVYAYFPKLKSCQIKIDNSSPDYYADLGFHELKY